jgi:hypothetical protein
MSFFLVTSVMQADLRLYFSYIFAVGGRIGSFSVDASYENLTVLLLLIDRASVGPAQTIGRRKSITIAVGSIAYIVVMRMLEFISHEELTCALSAREIPPNVMEALVKLSKSALLRDVSDPVVSDSLILFLPAH